MRTRCDGVTLRNPYHLTDYYRFLSYTVWDHCWVKVKVQVSISLLLINALWSILHSMQWSISGTTTRIRVSILNIALYSRAGWANRKVEVLTLGCSASNSPVKRMNTCKGHHVLVEMLSLDAFWRVCIDRKVGINYDHFESVLVYLEPTALIKT